MSLYSANDKRKERANGTPTGARPSSPVSRAFKSSGWHGIIIHVDMALNLQDDWNDYPNLSSIDHDVAFYRDRFETDASRLFARDVDHMISLIGPGPGGSESGELPNLQPFELHCQNLPLREDSRCGLYLIIAEALISLEFLGHVVTDVDSLQYLLRVSHSTKSKVLFETSPGRRLLNPRSFVEMIRQR